MGRGKPKMIDTGVGVDVEIDRSSLKKRRERVQT